MNKPGAFVLSRLSYDLGWLSTGRSILGLYPDRSRANEDDRA